MKLTMYTNETKMGREKMLFFNFYYYIPTTTNIKKYFFFLLNSLLKIGIAIYV